MNAHAQRLVDALRSGEFEQCQGSLKKGSNYCCLGVACELYRREHTEARWETDDEGKEMFFMHEGGAYPDKSWLPPEVQEWLGLQDYGGCYIKEDTHQSLYRHNDDGMSFAGIATLIESEPEGLFKA